jgi:lipid II:glycine glycyltransferase (peptidoglycan interpeptide bridge formation enzyme)
MIFPETRHFLQSHEWAEFQKALGKTVFERSGDGWSYVAIVERGDGKVGSFFKRLYTPYGPSYATKKALSLALSDLELLATEQGADYIRVEPVEQTTVKAVKNVDGYHKAAHDFQPPLTLFIDLNRTFDEVKSGMHRTSRYRWNRIERDEITFSISYEPKDLDAFIAMMQETSGRTKATFREAEYYRTLLKTLGPDKVAGIAYASQAGDIHVGVLFIDDMVASTRYYLYTGSFNKARKSGANAPLVVFLLKDAQEKGIMFFDFFGIAPLDAPSTHRWAGFSAFKRSFGGEERAFIGTWEKPIKPLKYKMMHAARKVATR